tara:strand:+ start:3922 stop:5316 length:1395 start_codon:yes stop_codon:yes gene_type:complete
MKRRDFLRNATASTAAVASAGWLTPLQAAPAPEALQTTLINMTLAGGPDFRHLLPPAMSSDPQSFGYQHWMARASSHGIAATEEAAQARWANSYTPVSHNGTQFGILNSCGWLKSMWDAGNVAIVNNVYGTNSRNHEHALLVWEHGDALTEPNHATKPGWGGKLAAHMDAKVVSVSRTPRPFCFGPHPTNPLSHRNDNLIAVKDSRNIALYEHDPADWSRGGRPVMSRALTSYYRAKRDMVPPTSPYHLFVQHEHVLRDFGTQINNRLQDIEIPLPFDPLLNHDSWGVRNLALQFRNVFDCLAAQDLLNMRLGSMDFGGWDSHGGQIDMIEPKLQLLFGAGQTFDALYQSLPEGTKDRLVFVIGGEFGRQLKANGDEGTDHGRGNSMLIIGRPVQGGLYGDMFPADELNRLDDHSPDILGQTSIEHVFGRCSDWLSPGSSSTIFPNRDQNPIEQGLDLTNLFVS